MLNLSPLAVDYPEHVHFGVKVRFSSAAANCDPR
jgi:hypothetical protein